jgi:hypothetical protein
VAKGGRRTGAGRKRKPVELKVLEGRFRKDRHAGAPLVVGGFPMAPEHLSEGEKALWETFPKPVWIGETDVVAVNGAVSTFARILANQRQRESAEQAGESTDGIVEREIKLWGRLMSILGELGLTPSSRAKVSAPKVDEHTEDKWAGILS